MTEKIKKFIKSKTAGTVGLVSVLVLVVGLTAVGAASIINSRSNTADDTAVVEKFLNGRGLSDYAEKRIKKDISPYEDYSSALSYVKKELDGVKTLECGEDGAFHVLIDGVKRFDISVVPTIYGRRAEVTGMYFTSPVYVEVPSGSTVKVGGKALSDGSEVPYRFLSEYEQNGSSVYTSQRYYIGELYGEPDIDAEYEGITLISPVLTDDTVCYPYPTEVTNDIVLTLPVGTELIVNGKKVTDTSSNVLVTYPFLSRFEEGLDDCLTSYDIDLGRFFDEPEIEAYYFGKKIEPKPNTRLYPLPDGNDGTEYTVSAPSDCTVKINGVSAGQTEIVSKETYPLFVYETTDGEGNRNTVSLSERYSFVYNSTQTVYKISGLYFEPEIKCYTADGTECAVYGELSGGNNIVFASPDSYELTAAMKKSLKKYCEYLAKYILEASSSTSTYYDWLRHYTISEKGSPSSLKVQQMWKTRTYVCKIKKFGTIEYTNLNKLSDSKYAVTASLPYTYASGKTTVEDKIRIEVLFSLSGSSMTFLNFNVVNETLK